MADMEFFDVKTKKKFTTSSFRLVEKKGRFFVVAKSPEGTHECWKVVSKDTAAKVKETK